MTLSLKVMTRLTLVAVYLPACLCNDDSIRLQTSVMLQTDRKKFQMWDSALNLGLLRLFQQNFERGNL